MIDKKEKLFFTLFQVNCDSTQVGEMVSVTGNLPSLGMWNPENSIQLTTNQGTYPTWKSKIQEIYCPRESFEYKYLIRKENSNQNQVRWEEISGNRVVKIKDIEEMAKHNIEFTVEIHDEKFGQLKNNKIYIGGLKENLKEIVHEASLKHVASTGILEDQEYSLEDKNKYIEFKISDYLKSLIYEIVKLNSEKKSWKDKLSLVNDLIKKDTVDKEVLALCSIYLFYINSGQIKCAEDGTHFRPNHHSGLAFSIFSFLLQNISEDNAIIIRSILKNLPSFSDQYLATVPLTRIRDIAHRNDIPKELKEEIKRTLQNKLHRSASPDDLKVCDNILKRITQSGSNYSKDFVNEFKIFNEELKEFFNALGLEKALNKLKEISRDEKLKDEIEKLIIIKYQPSDKNIQKLEKVVKLREMLISIENDELNNKEKTNKSLLQLASTSEIELEDFGYLIISEYIDKYYYSDKKIGEEGYHNLVKLCVLSLDNLILSKIKPEECSLIKEDMIYFTQGIKFENNNLKDSQYRLDILKLKSVLERCLNLFYEITEDVATYFNIPAYSLGKALNINPHSVRVFCESFVRTHTIFQFSKMITLLLHKIRDILKLPPFVTISTGEVSGYYLALPKLSDFNPDKHKHKEYILLLNESDGSEEIPNEIKGVVISHDLPQLSHLAIRARQNGVAFVCCLDNSIYKYKYYKQFQNGDYLNLRVKSDDDIKLEKISVPKIKPEIKIQQEETEDEEEEEITTQQQEVLEGVNKNGNNHNNSVMATNHVNHTEFVEEQFILPIEQAEQKIAGSKCTNMKLLSLMKTNDYETPKSLFIPYDVYTKFINQILTPEEYFNIDSCNYEDLESKSLQIREHIINKSMNGGLGETGTNTKDYDHDILNTIAHKINEMLPINSPLAIRSSSNLEDLKKSAGAGLFDSYLGIKNSPQNNEEIKRNICKVWASIFTLRGIQARRNAKVNSIKAKMGVLVQEMIDLNFSFVIHTVNPITKDKNEVYIELAIGQGETLASAKQKGSPYRLIYCKQENSVLINNYASFSNYIKNGNELKRISYRNEILSTNDSYLVEIGMRLGKISIFLEKEFNQIPQDIEGGVLEDKIYLIQTRPQII